MRKIALCMELSDFYEHGIARGLVRFAKSKPDWRLYGYGWMFRSLADIELWKGDGVIARVEDARSADRLSSLGLPIVDVAGAYSRPNFRSVTNDDFLTGYQAALHLLGCGFSRFAFLGVAKARWSDLRREGFQKALEHRGRTGAEGARAGDRAREGSAGLPALTAMRTSTIPECAVRPTVGFPSSSRSPTRSSRRRRL